MKTEKSQKRQRISNVKGFTFDDRSHTYLMDGVKLLSATTWIGNYKGDFNSVVISRMVAKRNKKVGSGLTDDTKVREYWKSYGSRLACLGTAGHEFCRQYWLDPENTYPITKLEENAKKLMDGLMSKFNIIEMEKPRGIKKYMMGFTIDIIMEDKKTKELYIGDFKFGKNFTKDQYKEDKGRVPNKLSSPFGDKDLRDVTWDTGSIQMGMYKHFYESMTGKKIKDCILFHIDGVSDFYGDKGYKAYRYKKEVNPIVAKEIKGQQERNLDVLKNMI